MGEIKVKTAVKEVAFALVDKGKCCFFKFFFRQWIYLYQLLFTPNVIKLSKTCPEGLCHESAICWGDMRILLAVRSSIS